VLFLFPDVGVLVPMPSFSIVTPRAWIVECLGFLPPTGNWANALPIFSSREAPVPELINLLTVSSRASVWTGDPFLARSPPLY